MAENKKSEFTVTDKRRFTADGDETNAQPEQPAEELAQETPPPSSPTGAPQEDERTERVVPPPPSAEERQALHDAFKQSTRQLDDALAGKMGAGHTAKDFEITFERFAASLYMSALVQLGLVHEQGAEPQVDLIGARHTIDTLGMITDKTKGNLTPTEENLLQNCLYELRMAYVDVTNMLTHPPQGGAPGMPPMPEKK
jgi:Domain of unknown function (DUF1844)